MDSAWLVEFAKQFNNVALLTYLIPLGIGIRRWKRLLPAYRPLFWFVLLPGALLNGALAEYGRHVLHNNILFLRLATIGESLLLGWAYYYAFHSGRSRYILLTAVGLFLGLAILEPLSFTQAFFISYNTFIHLIQSILLVGAAVAYFEQTLRELRNIDLGRDPMFLVSVGSILYYAGTVMVFVFEMQMQNQPDLIWIMYIIQFILLIVFNTFLALALWNGDQSAEQVPAAPEWPGPHA
ncbi:hypothetical protein [Hymenobacter cellulosivorans]|uniref:TIGR02206 family membrane protein n=1 Tax=Hymenobacter cellulosivorans TaxID=2932249 RepID=A0ABY4FF63_9BACT|nr:hypothetical protein [Hymenobacter cellulosivorans]UOQ55328.1 hypothetical protein MUN80_11365 [Hymenobacter cellulosivorans]